MTTIILTTIGIILASAATLMMMFYGGERFNAGQARAQADTLMNAGANVRGASGVYYATKGSLPRDPDTLISATAIKSMPNVNGIGIPDSGWRDYGAIGDRPKKAYVVTGVNDQVCKNVNKHIIGVQREEILTKPEGISGCYSENGDNVYYAMLSDAAPANAQLSSCDNPPRDDTDVAIDAQICNIKKSMNMVRALAQAGVQDEIYLSDANPQLARGVVSSVLYKPFGGKFGSTAYITFYLTDGHWEFTRFCQRWNATQKPLGVSNCDDWYFSHIVMHL